jgi:HEAT repeat protein
MHWIDPISGPDQVDLMRINRDIAGLMQVINISTDAAQRAKAAIGLGLLGDKKATPELRRALDDPDNRVKWHAACALVRLGDFQVMLQFMGELRPPFIPMVQMLSFDPWEWIRPLGKTAVDAVLVELEHPLSYKFLQMGADLALLYQDHRLVPVLWELLRHEDYRIRAVAADKLGSLPEDGSIARLVAVLGDEVEIVADRVADSLVMIGQAALPALKVASRSGNQPLCTRARKTIARLKSGE